MGLWAVGGGELRCFTGGNNQLLMCYSRVTDLIYVLKRSLWLLQEGPRGEAREGVSDRGLARMAVGKMRTGRGMQTCHGGRTGGGAGTR